MAPTRPAAHPRPAPAAPAASAASTPPASAAAAEGWGAPPHDAARVEVLLGDPRDPANPYGRTAVWAVADDALPAPPAGLPGTGRGRPCADGLARALRPLFHRDLALAHAWSIRPAGTPAPADVALLAPAGLLASAGDVLRTTARIVAGLGRHDPAVRQWHPVLACLFAELLACESLTALALRSCPHPDRPRPDRPDRPGSRPPGPAGSAPVGEGEGLDAVVGYVVPLLAGELLADLELVLNECGFGPASPEQRLLARLLEGRDRAGAGWRAARGAQARLARALARRGGPRTDPAAGPDADPAADPAADPDGDLAALFRVTVPAPALGAVTWRALAQSLAAATVPAGDGGDGGDGDGGEGGDGDGGEGGEGEALVRAGRRLLVEQRALRAAAAHAAGAGPADPAVRALADRQALLVLAAAVLGVRRAAAGDGPLFLGRAGWALVALGRITERLGSAPVHHAPDPRPGVWQELARRATGGADCDLYATRLLW
ncbi:hypothetical protein [Streptomyces sp. NPDC057616]|uniref:hypothetical protein n=1 Tax=Streptomyces sp. NPDC057616 TaxID=3346183 RepID=UPI0036C22517